MAKDKHAKIAAQVQPEKKPKFSDPEIQGSPLAWRFSATDRTGPFAWDIQPDPKFREVLEKLHEFEGKNWNDIKASGSHPIPRNEICKEAKDRLAEIERDDVDELMSFRLTGENRVWCIQSQNIMRVLWWDESHGVYPTKVDRADRQKDRRKSGKKR